ncbi:MAG: cytochrome c biogenesis protein [Schleiferiaceae bacterium]|nr:cytochrome c biogenesis protein [Schleiferiaceae bacterium]
MRGVWWKFLGLILVVYSLYMGLLGDVPRLDVLNETIRNLYYHVSMWFAMVSMLLLSMIYGIKHLSDNQQKWDNYSKLFAQTGMFFAVAGLLTGMVWANYTWGAPWVNDPKLNGTAVTMLVYLAYFVLRGSVDDAEKRGRLSGVYNIFAFVLMIVFIGILPRLTDSLHPGNGGNPGFSNYDLDANMRAVFYPAVLGWILIGVWITQLFIRTEKIAAAKKAAQYNNEYEAIQ